MKIYLVIIYCIILCAIKYILLLSLYDRVCMMYRYTRGVSKVGRCVKIDDVNEKIRPVVDENFGFWTISSRPPSPPPPATGGEYDSTDSAERQRRRRRRRRRVAGPNHIWRAVRAQGRRAVAAAAATTPAAPRK